MFRKIFPFLLLLYSLPPLYSASGFSLQFWMKTTTQDTLFPAILSNKPWASDSIVDFTSNSNYGQSLDTGTDYGWAFAIQPNGAWSWNMGDGTHRVDYLPTAERQRVNDGEWHLLAMSVDYLQRTSWLYFDGIPVAIYSLDGLRDLRYDYSLLERLTFGEGEITIEGFRMREETLDDGVVLANWVTRGGRKAWRAIPEFGGRFRVMAWNIWHGGRRNGVAEGIGAVVRAIRESGADIISMQETYGSGPIIADSLGYLYFYRSSNLSVMSRFPILQTHGLYEPFRFGGVTIELGPRVRIRVFSLWIHYLPSLTEMITADAREDLIIQEENKTRGQEIKDILKSLWPLLDDQEDIPVIVAGDFNSPSHKDWTPRTAHQHLGLTVDWPVSRSMEKAGFQDAFRLIHSDPLKNYGRTWSPRFRETWQDRIDYIYFTGKRLNCKDAAMIDQVQPQWPSDHAAVIAEFQWR